MLDNAILHSWQLLCKDGPGFSVIEVEPLEFESLQDKVGVRQQELLKTFQ
jgi:hypothetical protein